MKRLTVGAAAATAQTIEMMRVAFIFENKSEEHFVEYGVSVYRG
jgi:hypothetical protein